MELLIFPREEKVSVVYVKMVKCNEARMAINGQQRKFGSGDRMSVIGLPSHSNCAKESPGFRSHVRVSPRSTFSTNE